MSEKPDSWPVSGSESKICRVSVCRNCAIYLPRELWTSAKRLHIHTRIYTYSNIRHAIPRTSLREVIRIDVAHFTRPYNAAFNHSTGNLLSHSHSTLNSALTVIWIIAKPFALVDLDSTLNKLARRVGFPLLGLNIIRFYVILMRWLSWSLITSVIKASQNSCKK